MSFLCPRECRAPAPMQLGFSRYPEGGCYEIKMVVTSFSDRIWGRHESRGDDLIIARASEERAPPWVSAPKKHSPSPREGRAGRGGFREFCCRFTTLGAP